MLYKFMEFHVNTYRCRCCEVQHLTEAHIKKYWIIFFFADILLYIPPPWYSRLVFYLMATFLCVYIHMCLPFLLLLTVVMQKQWRCDFSIWVITAMSIYLIRSFTVQDWWLCISLMLHEPPHFPSQTSLFAAILILWNIARIGYASLFLLS